MITVAIEIGGTFTDLVLARDGKIIKTLKVLSTPHSPEIGALNALDSTGTPTSEVMLLVHGSTVATNAVLERKGAEVGLLVTEGFRDILEIQREGREDLYDLHYRKVPPLVSRDQVHPVRERISARGQIVLPLDETHLMQVLDSMLRQRPVEALAICLLHAYRYPVHEKKVQEIISQKYDIRYITMSSEILPEFREYERASTTVLNAYVAPIMDRYIASMGAGLRQRQFEGRFRIVQSNGGVLPAGHISSQAVRTLLSGPAAGVIGATRLATQVGLNNIITVDMGGTSTDVCLVADGRPQVTTDGKIDGLPVRVPMIDIVTVGAGGGSIATVRTGRLLRVGPESAGADPGPACYNKGGQEPTVTDANVVLGIMRPDSLFSGNMTLSADRAEAAIMRIARALDIPLHAAAESIIKVATATMAQAIRLVSIERGYDPREYTLVAFGGAGPLHAVALAQELDAPGVLIPNNPGVLSAFGLLVADFRRDYVRTLAEPGAAMTPLKLKSRFDELETWALTELMDYQIPVELRRVEYSVDMRYQGQAFELNIPIDLEGVMKNGIACLVDDFHKAHAVRYGHSFNSDEVELVNYRLSVSVAQQDVQVAPTRINTSSPTLEKHEIFANGRWVTCAFYTRKDLNSGDRIVGPAVVNEPSATTFIPERWVGQIDGAGNIHITRGETS